MNKATVALLAFATLVSSAAARADAVRGRVVDRGIVVDLKVAPKAIRDGDTLAVSFAVRDEATQTPLGGARPLAWLAARDPRDARHDCAADVARFLGASLADRAAADFNSYYVLALNDDASISVVDPRFSFGGSQLLAMLTLESSGEDWALTPDGRTLYVSMPDAGKIAVADTMTWKVTRNVDVGARPGRIALQPDGKRLWIVTDRGTAVVSTAGPAASRAAVLSGEDAARPAGEDAGGPAGPAFAFSEDFAFVARGAAIDVFDLHSMARKSVALALEPRVLAYSSAAQLAYAGDPATGHIVGVNDKKVVARIDATAGFSQLRFAPGGRYGFLPNPAKNIVEIFDAASNRVVRTVDVADAPDQVTFTERLAFVRRRGSDAVIMIPLQRIGGSDVGTGVADFTGGEHALGAGRVASPADSIVEAPDGPAVLVANPGDSMIYYYKEGMAAPMGGFSNYGRQPRAVLVVDRSLRERAKGVYSAAAQVADPGAYDVVFFLDSPRVVGCFPLEVEARPETLAKRARAVVVEPLHLAAHVPAGAPTHIRFRLADAATHRQETPADVQVVVMQAPGIWQRRTLATQSADGTFDVEVIPPSAGVYYVWVASRSAGLPINNPQFITFEVD